MVDRSGIRSAASGLVSVVLPEPSGNDPVPTEGQRPSPTNGLILPLIGVAVMLGLGALLIALWRPGPGGGPLATPPVYVTTTDRLAMVLEQQRQGQYALAAANARTILRQPQLSPHDRVEFARLAVANDLEAIWGQPDPQRDLVAHRQAIEQYRAAEQLAQEQGIALPLSRRQAADRAYKSGKFLLAQLLVEEALAAGDLSACERAQLHFYASSIYNSGYWLSRHDDPAVRRDGWALVVAAHRLDERFRLGQGEAGGQLRASFGAETAWPPAAPIALLTAPIGCGQ
jgi:hypothetical protein